MTITGATSVYALVADPVSHVRAPEVLNAHFAANGIDVVVIPVHVPAQDLESVVTGLRHWRNLVGIGVTIPHKERMTQLVDELTAPARACGATNVVRRDASGRLVGTQLDGVGMGSSLEDAGVALAGATALLVGAGGTAKAIAHDLASRGVRDLVIENRTRHRAEALALSVAASWPAIAVQVGYEQPRKYDVAINATSLGMHTGDSLPLRVELLSPNTVVADVVMSPPETPLLAAAQERGCRTHPGRLMLEAQVKATVDFLGLAQGVTR